MRTFVILLALVVLTSMNVFFLNDQHALVSPTQPVLADGSYTSTLHIISDDNEYIGEETITLAVNGDEFSLQLQRYYNQCLYSKLYAKGKVTNNDKGVGIEFTKVMNERLNVSCTTSLIPTRRSLTEPLLATPSSYISTLYRLTYQSEQVYCFESDDFGSICLNKE